MSCVLTHHLLTLSPQPNIHQEFFQEFSDGGQNEGKGVVGGLNFGVWSMGVANYDHPSKCPTPLKETLYIYIDHFLSHPWSQAWGHHRSNGCLHLPRLPPLPGPRLCHVVHCPKRHGHRPGDRRLPPLLRHRPVLIPLPSGHI